jgi:Mrp family chromosome partitioning ATPase
LEQRQTGKLNRSTLEQLEVQMRQQPAVERVREVLLDPTRIDPHLIALSDFNPRAAKYFDQVAVSLISVSYKRLCKRVLVASAQQGEGRTCVTLNLAGALARARQRVLVVDCDLANPSVLRLLGIDAPLGLSEAVHRGLGPNSAALRVQPAGFNILPTREKIQHTAELLASPRFHEMLQICEPDYDFILFDSSPLLESADANLLAGLTDATMLVIRPGMTTTQQMAKAVSLFNEKDICGVVLNRVAG